MSGQLPAPIAKPMLSDRSYNLLKGATTVALPALGALYFALAQIWNLPKGEEVVGSIAALNTFFGVLLGVSTRSYNKSDAKYDGEFVYKNDDNYRVVMNQDPMDLDVNKQNLNLRIINRP